MSEQDKVTLLGVVFSVIVILSVLVVSAKDVYGWFYRKLTKRAADETICTCTQNKYENVVNPGHCMACGKPFRQ